MIGFRGQIESNQLKSKVLGNWRKSLARGTGHRDKNVQICPVLQRARQIRANFACFGIVWCLFRGGVVANSGGSVVQLAL